MFVFIARLWGDADVDLAALPLDTAALFDPHAAVSMIVSSLYVRFRDIAIIWGVVATMLFYATPVLYPLEACPNAPQPDPPQPARR